MRAALLDTDTLSQIMKGKNSLVLARADQYVMEHGRFAFSLMTRFEILRGLRARGATAQERRFAAMCRGADILPISQAVIDLAADLYADLHKRGQLISDADLLIAATALVHGLVLVTSNTAHFSRVPDLPLECWTAL